MERLWKKTKTVVKNACQRYALLIVATLIYFINSRLSQLIHCLD